MTALIVLVAIPGACLAGMVVALVRRSRRGSAALTAPHLRNATGHDLDRARSDLPSDAPLKT